MFRGDGGSIRGLFDELLRLIVVVSWRTYERHPLPP